MIERRLFSDKEPEQFTHYNCRVVVQDLISTSVNCFNALFSPHTVNEMASCSSTATAQHCQASSSNQLFRLPVEELFNLN